MKIEEWRNRDAAGNKSPLRFFNDDELIAQLKVYQTFIRCWLAWADVGAPEKAPFSRRAGLCGSADKFDHMSRRILDWRFQHRLYPFGAINFRTRLATETMHLCDKRIEWAQQELGLLCQALAEIEDDIVPAKEEKVPSVELGKIIEAMKAAERLGMGEYHRKLHIRNWVSQLEEIQKQIGEI